MEEFIFQENLIMEKLLFVIGSFNVGGTELQFMKIFENLIKRKKQVSVITVFEEGKYSDQMKKMGVKVFSIKNSGKNIIMKFFKYISVIHLIYSKTKLIKPDLINFVLPHSYILGGLATIFFKTKKIMWRRSENLYQKKIIFSKNLERLLHKKMYLIVCNSKNSRKQLIQEEYANEEKVKLIYNGIIKSKKIEKKLKRIDFCSRNMKIFVHVANFIPYKNQLLVLKAILKLNKNNFRYFFIGDDSTEYGKFCKKYVIQNNLINVSFLGLKDSDFVKNFLKISDIGVLSSEQEGCSNSLLEYISENIPVIASNVGGNNEIIFNNVNGILFKKNNLNSIIKAFSKINLLNKKKLLQKNKELIDNKFNFEKNFLKIFQLIKIL